MTPLDLSLTAEELDSYMASQRTARLATADPSGSPHVVPLWFVWVDGRLYMNTTRGNRSVRNVEGNPRGAATVDDGESYDQLRGVVVAGPVREAADHSELEPVVRAFSEKYFAGNPPHFTLWRNRLFLRLDPSRVTSWDFRKIPEARARAGR